MKTEFESEQELKSFLEHRQSGNFVINLTLRGCGMHTTYDREKAVNICEVNGHGNCYIFGGITEKFYDKMAEQFDSRMQRGNYFVYNLLNQNIEGYFENEIEAEEYASTFKNAEVRTVNEQED